VGAASASGSASPPVGHAGPAANGTIGYFDGYWYDTPIHVNQRDGLNASEARAYVRRTMARVEMIRHRNFERAVPVEVISRAQYQANRSPSGGSTEHARWNQQVWEAPLILGSKTNLSASMQSYYSNNVLGFYDSGANDIRIVVPSGKHAHIDHSTLAHELTHALQDQHYNLSKAKYSGQTQDRQLATSGLIEGGARYVETVYTDNCNNGTWQCVASPPSASVGGSGSSGTSTTGASANGGSSASPPLSLQLTLYFPYASGPGYVHDLLQRGGWAAVDAAWRNPPNATSTIIHDAPPVRKPVHLDRNAARNGWRTYPSQGVNGTDTLGEASIFVGLWWQSYEYGANVVPKRAIQGVNKYRSYRFVSAASSGWAGDKVLPYRRNGQNGFVWKSAWNTSDDASQFAAAYVRALKAHGASLRDGVWVVSKSDGYQGAYRVVRQNDTVTVVKGPDVSAVNDLRPSLAGNASHNPSSSTGAPGFGVLVAGAAMVAVTLLARRRN